MPGKKAGGVMKSSGVGRDLGAAIPFGAAAFGYAVLFGIAVSKSRPGFAIFYALMFALFVVLAHGFRVSLPNNPWTCPANHWGIIDCPTCGLTAEEQAAFPAVVPDRFLAVHDITVKPDTPNPL